MNLCNVQRWRKSGRLAQVSCVKSDQASPVSIGDHRGTPVSSRVSSTVNGKDDSWRRINLFRIQARSPLFISILTFSKLTLNTITAPVLAPLLYMDEAM